MNGSHEADALRVACAWLERERDRALDDLAACRRALQERVEAHESDRRWHGVEDACAHDMIEEARHDARLARAAACETRRELHERAKAHEEALRDIDVLQAELRECPACGGCLRWTAGDPWLRCADCGTMCRMGGGAP